MKALTFKINTYIAMLMITVVGSAASLIILHVANADTLSFEKNQLSSVTEYLK